MTADAQLPLPSQIVSELFNDLGLPALSGAAAPIDTTFPVQPTGRMATGALFALSVGKFVAKNPATDFIKQHHEALITGGCAIADKSDLIVETWNHLQTANDIAEFIGYGRTIQIAKWSAEVAVDGFELIEPFLDHLGPIGDFADDCIDETVSGAISAALGVGGKFAILRAFGDLIDEGFDWLNQEKIDRIKALQQLESAQNDFIAKLKCGVPPLLLVGTTPANLPYAE